MTIMWNIVETVFTWFFSITSTGLSQLNQMKSLVIKERFRRNPPQSAHKMARGL
jgi:hypothetical protein